MSSTSTAARLEGIALGALLLCTVAAVAGYAIFALHPERLAGVPGAPAAYGLAMTLFPRGHILLGVAATAVVLTRRVGRRWLPAFAALYAASLASELLGTATGLPFGPYRYTPGLGPMWFAHVPVLIPASWFTMAIASFALTRHVLGATRHTTTIVVASLVLAAWDLVLDPAMSQLAPYWIWGTSGPYYGMPLLNLVGWYVTGLALMTLLVALRAQRWTDPLPAASVRALGVVYLANLALPMGLAVAGGMSGAAIIAAVVLAVTFVLARVARVRLTPAVERR